MPLKEWKLLWQWTFDVSYASVTQNMCCVIENSFSGHSSRKDRGCEARRFIVARKSAVFPVLINMQGLSKLCFKRHIYVAKEVDTT